MYLETTGAGTLKLFWYWFVIVAFEYLAIPWTQLLILWVLMLLDFISWISKQYVLDKKEITSYRMATWSLKKLITMICVLAIALLLASFELPVLDRQTFLAILLSLFIVNETYSIIGNTYAVRTWKTIREYDAISLILKKIGDNILKFLEDKTK